MPLKRNLTEAEALEQYRVSFQNVENQSEIATIMAEFGYDEILLTEGKTLLTKTREAFDFNIKEDDETSQAYNYFATVKHQLAKTFTLHRKKAKVIFRKDALILDRLAISGSSRASYIKWLETVKKFYSVAILDTEITSKLARLKITETDLQDAITRIAELESARAAYLREKGESQHATKTKDTAFGEIDDWMNEFYAVSKIALEDSPQLLESLGKFVRS